MDQSSGSNRGIGSHSGLNSVEEVVLSPNRWCLLFFLAFAILFSAPATGLCEKPSETPEAIALRKASEHLDAYFFAIQSMGNCAFLYAGEEMQVLSEQKFSGTFPFVGFRAIKFPEDGKPKRERFWSISSRSLVASMMSGFAYDELLIGDERWFTQHAGQIQLYKPDPNRPFKYSFLHLEPRVSVLCFCGAVAGGKSSQPRYYRHISQQNLLKAAETIRGIDAVFSDGEHYWYHLLFDKSQGFMPTRVATTEIDSELEKDQSNARLVNRMRWKQAADNIWLPEYGENVYYFGKTAADHELVKRVAYRVLWIPLEDLPDNLFEKEALSSLPSIRRASMEPWLEQLNAIKPIDEEP